MAPHPNGTLVSGSTSKSTTSPNSKGSKNCHPVVHLLDSGMGGPPVCTRKPPGLSVISASSQPAMVFLVKLNPSDVCSKHLCLITWSGLSSMGLQPVLVGLKWHGPPHRRPSVVQNFPQRMVLIYDGIHYDPLFLR